MTYSIIEQFTQAKTGHNADNEDRIVITDDFVAVIDGMTPQNKSLYSGVSPAKICIQLLEDCLKEFPKEIICYDAADRLTNHIKEYYEHHYILEEVNIAPHKRMGANLILYSHARQELWMIGDCHCLIDEQHITNEKMVDTLLASMRSTIIHEYLLNHDIRDLLDNDYSFTDIKPFLQQQYQYQNNKVSSPLSYTVIDGFPVTYEQIKIIDVSTVTTIVLASDGYPILEASLCETEEVLKRLLENDPLCYQIMPTTKGMKKGNVSFDDRSYIKFQKKLLNKNS